MSSSSGYTPRHLTVEVGVRHGKTMTQHHLDEEGTLTFHNASDEPLVISAASGAPFKEEGCGDAVSELSVPPRGNRIVRVAPGFRAEEFIYSARIGDAEPEDPVVILDRRR
jgi:hypothetical protein